MGFVDHLTAFVRINRLAVSTVSGVGHVSPAREQELDSYILEQLVHSVGGGHCVSHGNQRNVRTPLIFVGDFIGMPSLWVGLVTVPRVDHPEVVYRDLYVWVCFHHPRPPTAGEKWTKGKVR